MKKQQRINGLYAYSSQKFTSVIKTKNTISSYRKSYIAWDSLERANKPKDYTGKTKYLGKNAKALLSVVVQKLKKKEKVFFNQR